MKDLNAKNLKQVSGGIESDELFELWKKGETIKVSCIWCNKIVEINKLNYKCPYCKRNEFALEINGDVGELDTTESSSPGEGASISYTNL